MSQTTQFEREDPIVGIAEHGLGTAALQGRDAGVSPPAPCSPSVSSAGKKRGCETVAEGVLLSPSSYVALLRSPPGDTPFPLPLIDLRDPSCYLSRRLLLRSSATVNLPFSELGLAPSSSSSPPSVNRSCELPPRDVSFDVLLPSCCPSSVSAALSFFGATSSSATGASRTPWRLRHALLPSQELWDCLSSSASAAGADGEDYEDGKGAGKAGSKAPFPWEVLCGVEPPFPEARLWRPDSLVSDVLRPLLAELPGGSAILDLGSGAGRDVAYLAEELPSLVPPLRLIGVDNHKGSPARCLPLWRRRGVQDITHFELLDLKKPENLRKVIEEKGLLVRCMYCVRFLNRPLLSYLSSPSTTPLLPSGIFALSHFVLESDGSFPFDHPRPAECLKQGELEALFGPPHWQVLHCSVGRDSDAGRPLMHFVAKRLLGDDEHCERSTSASAASA